MKTLGGIAALSAYLLLAGGLRRRWPEVSLKQRLQAVPRRGLPLRGPVRVWWDAHQIPFIEAEHDSDLAVALGIVHAHLRLAQMDMMRRIAQGRLAEALGPVAVEFDHVLRVLDFGRVSAEIAAKLPAESREWLDNFALGINAYIGQMKDPPPELALLGATIERWTIDDLIAISRLASADFTWSVWAGLLKLRQRTDWADLWQRLYAETPLPVPGFPGSGASSRAEEWLPGGMGRGGSNSLAVSARRSATGSALIANDPHLSIVLPSLWLIAGMRSPGFHAVGLMIPGVPAIAEGRNPWIAWGGTNMHAASSELFDVTGLPPNEILAREETIRVRWGADRRVVIEETPYGPIISKAPILRAPRDMRLALHWIGHRPTDETSAMLALNRARNWDEFLDALDRLAIPALNMIYADTEGRVGQALAAWLPHRPPQAPTDFVSDVSQIRHWSRLASARELPSRLDPPDGFVASANDRPPAADILIGHFFSPDNRVERLREILSALPRAEVADLARLQQDVRLRTAAELRDLLIGLAERSGLAEGNDPPSRRMLAALRDWDGTYEADSAGALAFELLAYHLVVELHGADSLELYLATWDPWALLRRDLASVSEERLRAKMPGAVARAAGGLARYRTWGAAHRLRLSHPLSALPVVGRRFRFADLASGGSNETVMKTAHGFSGKRHRVKFGANARHISDLSDLDENYFALLGGQDGWLGSANFLDQLGHWRRGDLIRVPMRPETVRKEFPYLTELEPG